jgi:hypothetical protein
MGGLVEAFAVGGAALLALGVGEPSGAAHDRWSFRFGPAGRGPVSAPDRTPSDVPL